jgi:AhpD family alkylhydroperoxidase
MTIIDELMETGRAAEVVAPAPVQDRAEAAAQPRLDYNTASPEGTKALGALHAYIHRSGLPSRLIDLVYLRVSQLNGCAYCVDMHSRDLLKSGMAVDQLVLVPLWREAVALFDRKEKAALAWAEIVTRLGEHGVPDAAFDAAAAEFDDKQLADLTIAIGLMNAYNRLAISFRSTPTAVARRSRTVPAER